MSKSTLLGLRQLKMIACSMTFQGLFWNIPDDIIHGHNTGDAIKKQSEKLLTLIQDQVKSVRISALFHCGFVRPSIMTMLNRARAAIP